ncbi:hypothetical protein FRC07_004379 [Ceratobasidium sp. 392]|nr:hypothetical protein FRC07_004379 [Ceratobasidium sp. 392]
MGKSPWTKPELKWFDERIPDWTLVRDGPGCNIPVNGVRPPDAWISRLVQNFLDEFDTRKWSNDSQHNFNTPQEYHSYLNHKLRQLMNNRARKAGGKCVAEVPKMNKHTTARHLVMQDFKDPIKIKAAELRAENSVLDSRTVWNYATTAVLNQLREDDPAAVAEIEARALALREASNRNYAEQDSEVLQTLLHVLPKRMLTTALEWGRTTGASIYIAAMYDTQENGIQFVDACSDDIEEYRYSKACEGFRHDFSQHVCKTLEWQGGHGPAPYSAISQDCQSGIYQFIERQQLPDRCSFQDPSRMLAGELQAWYQHIEQGQQGNIVPERIFQFARVMTSDNRTAALYTGLCVHRHPGSRLEWTADQVLYAQKVESTANQSISAISWLGLPVARVLQTYQPFTRRQRESIKEFSSVEHDIESLADLVERLDQLGASHDSDHSQSLPNLHLPGNFHITDMNVLFEREWPHDSFWQESHDDHPQYATTTLLYWLKSCLSFKHLASNTWLGGPGGARWLVALLFHLVRALTLVDRRKDIPRQISNVFSDSLQQRHWHMINTAIVWLKSELLTTCDALRTTFDVRAQAWKEQVKHVIESHRIIHPGTLVAGVPIVRAKHNALPIEDSDLHACYLEITRAPIERSLASAAPELPDPPVASLPRDTPEQQDATSPHESRQAGNARSGTRNASSSSRAPASGSPSAEVIDLPDFASDVSRESNCGNQPNGVPDKVQIRPDVDEFMSFANRTLGATTPKRSVAVVANDTQDASPPVRPAGKRIKQRQFKASKTNKKKLTRVAALRIGRGQSKKLGATHASKVSQRTKANVSASTPTTPARPRRHVIPNERYELAIKLATKGRKRG